MAKQPGAGQEGFVFSLGKVTKRNFRIARDALISRINGSTGKLGGDETVANVSLKSHSLSGTQPRGQLLCRCSRCPGASIWDHFSYLVCSVQRIKD